MPQGRIARPYEAPALNVRHLTSKQMTQLIYGRNDSHDCPLMRECCGKNVDEHAGEIRLVWGSRWHFGDAAEFAAQRSALRGLQGLSRWVSARGCCRDGETRLP